MLKELFSKNKNIVINTDIDGILSGIILHKYFNCKIVGFSNSKETVWLSNDVHDIYAPIYIDLYVVNPNVICIEQHIIATDNNHLAKIKNYKTKINPNLERGKIFCDDYYHKYPFGTVHYLISLMEAEGIKVSLPNLNQKIVAPNGASITIGQMILRADDALYSSLGPYADNALDWWKWLLRKSNNADSIMQLFDYVKNSNPNLNKYIKDKTGTFFMSGFGCTGKDGAFDSICDFNNEIIADFIGFVKFVNSTMQGNITIPHNCIPHVGLFKKRLVKGFQKEILNELMNDPELFSYAFIYGPNSNFQNYSYTTNLSLA